MSLIVASLLCLTTTTATSPQQLEGYQPDGGKNIQVYEIAIDGDIDPGLAAYVARTLKGLKKGDIAFLKIKTFGGRVDSAVTIRDALLDTPATTIAYVDHRAISAGALITLACDTIFMSPGASIGAATPVQQGEGGKMEATSEKVVSYMRSEMRATAEAKGRRGDLAEAMVDADIEIKGITEKGKLLTLTGDKAFELKIADAIAQDFDEAVRALNLQNAQRIQPTSFWMEKLARVLSNQILSSLLMSLGFLGIMLEFYAPGHIFPGVAGVLCLALFFLGQYGAALAGWEETLLFVLGVVLIFLEITVIPGFGLVGLLGGLALLASIAMAFVEFHLPIDVAFELGYAQQALETAVLHLAWGLVLIAGVLVAFWRFLPRSRFARRVVLDSSTSSADGYVASSDADTSLVGKRGKVAGMLRPAGIALIDGRRVDVMSNGDFIEDGTEIEVITATGSKIVVRKV